ncbi:hypothetical protein ACIRQY_29085 [Streptomyces sp. NPDC101490]|uniref:hypothetical protein n=1 Tax=Streptomyces sp. NPDC101490 TaxID=3366143 RepID=UPI003803657A
MADVIGIAPPAEGTADAVWLARAVAAIDALAVDTVPRLRLIEAGAEPGQPLPQWPEDIRAALLLQAQRIFARRSSPTGVAGYSDLGGAAVYVSRWDPDVERLLRIGSWAPPQTG